MNSKLETRNSKLVSEFCAAYGLSPDQMSFDGAEPIFDFDALSLLINTLTDIPAIKVGLAKFHDSMKLAESTCLIRLPNGFTREYFACARVGESLHDGRLITNDIQAITVSRARSLRAGARAVGFDPVKFHEARKKGQSIALSPLTEEREWEKYRAEVHMLAGPLNCNFIKKTGDRTEYENLLASYFQGRTSSKDLDREEKAQWLGMLRAWATKENAA